PAGAARQPCDRVVASGSCPVASMATAWLSPVPGLQEVASCDAWARSETVPPAPGGRNRSHTRPPGGTQDREAAGTPLPRVATPTRTGWCTSTPVVVRFLSAG